MEPLVEYPCLTLSLVFIIRVGGWGVYMSVNRVSWTFVQKEIYVSEMETSDDVYDMELMVSLMVSSIIQRRDIITWNYNI